MAFVSSSKDLGRWEGIGHDPDRNVQVRFRLRRLDDDDSLAVEKKLGKFVRDPNTGVKSRVIPQKKRREAALRQACMIWTGCQNLWVKLTTTKDIAVYQAATGKTGTAINDEVCFDGDIGTDHPHEKLKRMVLRSMVGLTNRVITYGLGEAFEDVDDEDPEEDDDDEEDEGDAEYSEAEKQEDLKKTSSPSSSSSGPSPISENT